MTNRRAELPRACHSLLCGFSRPFLLEVGYFVLGLAEVLSGFLNAFSALFVKLVNTLVGDTLGSTRYSVGGILGGRVFIGIIALLRFILCLA